MPFYEVEYLATVALLIYIFSKQDKKVNDDWASLSVLS